MSAVFAQRTFDAGFPCNGVKFFNNLQTWPPLATIVLPFGYERLCKWELFGMTNFGTCCNDDGKNVSLCRSLVVSAVFTQKTFDAGFPCNGSKFFNNLQIWPPLATNFLPFGYERLCKWELFGMTIFGTLLQ